MCGQLITIWGHWREHMANTNYMNECDGMWKNYRKDRTIETGSFVLNVSHCCTWAVHAKCKILCVHSSAGLMNHAIIFFFVFSLQICSHFSSVFSVYKFLNTNNRLKMIFGKMPKYCSQLLVTSAKYPFNRFDQWWDDHFISQPWLCQRRRILMCDKSINVHFSTLCRCCCVHVTFRRDFSFAFSQEFTAIDIVIFSSSVNHCQIV